MPISRSDEALAFAAKNGNSKCFDELYKRYYEKIYALAMTVVKNSADAADMLELTFIKAWEQLPHLENTALFHTWLHRIALVQCHAAIRQRKPLTPADADTTASELLQVTADLMLPEAYAERAELSEQLRTTVEALPPEQRETLLLYYYNRLDTEEIAQAMDCTAETVQVQLYFAREAIRASVKEPETHAGAAAYGAAAVPFATIFVSQIQQLLLSPQTAAAIYQIILQGILQPSAVIPLASAVLQATSSAAGAAGAVAQGAAVAAGTAQGTAGAAAQGAAVAAKGAAVATKGAAVAAKVTAAQGAAAAAKAGVPLATKIVAGVVAAGVVTGGSVVAWRALHTNPIVNAQVGEEITLGTCEQDNNTENGAEDIIWRVLAREDDKLLAVSKYVLDGAEHAQLGNNPMWSATGLRQTLNETFFAQSFSEEEQRYICDAYLLSEDSWGRQKDDEVSVEKVFILTLEETQRYFSSDEARAAEATAYAAAKGARTDEQNRAAWWVRSIEFENDQGMVKEDGTASGELGGHSGMTLGVRPAIWIDTKAIADGGNARSVVPPLKTTTLPKSLQTFINTFGTHFFCGTFDCEKVTPESNILLGVIGESECVDYSLYSDVLAEQNKFDNWVHAIQTPSPIKEINDMSSTYKVLDAEPVDMILKTIFHCTEENIQTLRGMTGTFRETDPYGYADGKYYSATGGHGDIGFDISRKDGYYRDGCGYFTLELKPGVPVAGLEQPVTMYVKVSLLPHEGKPWWSLYYYSQDPFDGAGYQGSEYHAAYARALFLHRPDAKSSEKLARGSDNTQSSAVPLTALADICGDETPELLYAGTGDRENTSDYPFIHIAGIENGEIKELYTTVADAVQPFDVSIVMNRKTGELFQYTAFRVKDGGNTAVYRLHEDNGQLRPEEILHENMVYAVRPGEGHYEYSCRVNGADVSKDAYDSAWNTFKSGIDTVVLHCATNKTLGGYAFSDLPSLSKSFDALQTRLIYRLRP